MCFLAVSSLYIFFINEVLTVCSPPLSTGTMAAGAQAAVGNVVAGGAIATAQSAAMGGYGVAVVSTAVQGAGATVVGAAGAAMAWMKSKS